MFVWGERAGATGHQIFGQGAVPPKMCDFEKIVIDLPFMNTGNIGLIILILSLP